MNRIEKQRLEQLVRQGIIPSAKLQILMRAIAKSRLGTLLTPEERNIMFVYMDKLQSFVLGDQGVFSRARLLYTQRTKYQTEETTVEIDENVRIVDGPEDEEKMRATAERKARKLSIRKREKYQLLSPALKKEKKKAGMDEEVLNFHQDYKERFEAALEYYGVTNIRDLPEEKKAEFFAVVDEAAKMDPVGQEDDDIDNDGDSDSSDAYLKKRRKAINKAMKKEEVEQVDELKKSTLSSYIQKAADPAKKKSNVNLASKAAHKLATSDDLNAGEKEDMKAYTRSKGIQTAAKKLAKEEVEEVDESLLTKAANKKARSGSKEDLMKRFSAGAEAIEKRRKEQGEVRVDKTGKRIANEGYYKDMDTNKKEDERLAKAIKQPKADVKKVKEETEQLDEYGNPAATPDRLAMIRRAAERVQSGQAAKDVKKQAMKDMKQKGAQKGMAPLKKDVEEQVQELRKMIKEGNNKIEAYRLLSQILNNKENSGE